MQRNADIFMTALLPLRAKSQNRYDSTLHTSCARKKKYSRFIVFFSLFQVFTLLIFTSIAFFMVAQVDIRRKGTAPFVGIHFTYLPTLCHHQNALVFGNQIELWRKTREKIMQIFRTQIHTFMAALNGNRRYYCQFPCERILYCENFNRSEKKINGRKIEAKANGNRRGTTAL